MRENLTVVYSCDQKYARIMAVSIVSLFETNLHMNQIKVYCLLYNVAGDTKKELIHLGEKYKRTVIGIDSVQYCEKYRFWEKYEDSRYVRLILDKILTEEDLVIYFDCDLIVNGDLRALINRDYSNYAAAAVLDTCRMDARLESNIQNVDTYFNSGVLVANLKYWRDNNLLYTFKCFKKLIGAQGIYRDQRVLNGTLGDHVLILPVRYNVTPEIFQFTSNQIKKLCGISEFYSQPQLNEAKKNPVIIHFAGRSIDRPWFKNSEHSYTKIYREYMVKDDFTNFPLWEETFKNIIKWKIKKRIPFCMINIANRLSHNQ